MNEISSRAPFSAKELWTDEDEPRRLVLLSDEVRSHALPWKMASAELLNELTASPEFYIARAGRSARLVTDADVWRCGLLSGEKFLLATGHECENGRWTTTPAWCNAQLVERELISYFYAYHRPAGALTAEKLAAFPAVPAWCGARGLIRLLRLQWLNFDADIDCLDEGEAGYVAILAKQSASTPTKKRVGERSQQPTDEEMLREIEVLKQEENRAPIKTVMTRHRLSRDTIERKVKAAKNARAAKTQTNASIFAKADAIGRNNAKR